MSDDIVERAQERLVGVSLEQVARNLLEECGVEDAQRFTAADVVSLANFVGLVPELIAEVLRLRLHQPEGACAGAGKKPAKVTKWFGKEPNRALCNVCHNEFSVNVNGRLRFHKANEGAQA